jgi:hypothetical protein
MVKGGCYCGQVRYEAAGPVSHQTICHCSICRKTTGAPFVAWFSVPRSTFKFVRGDPARFKSTAKGTRSFCPNCATQLTFESVDLPDEIDITTCSLDDPDPIAPQDHTWTRSRLPWIALGDDLPAHAELRPTDSTKHA